MSTTVGTTAFPLGKQPSWRFAVTKINHSFNSWFARIVINQSFFRILYMLKKCLSFISFFRVSFQVCSWFSYQFFSLSDGNFGSNFRVEKTTGVIRSNASFDREEKEAFEIVVKATSNPDYIVYEVSKQNSENSANTSNVWKTSFSSWITKRDTRYCILNF